MTLHNIAIFMLGFSIGSIIFSILYSIIFNKQHRAFMILDKNYKHMCEQYWGLLYERNALKSVVKYTIM